MLVIHDNSLLLGFTMALISSNVNIRAVTSLVELCTTYLPLTLPYRYRYVFDYVIIMYGFLNRVISGISLKLQHFNSRILRPGCSWASSSTIFPSKLQSPIQVRQSWESFKGGSRCYRRCRSSSHHMCLYSCHWRHLLTHGQRKKAKAYNEREIVGTKLRAAGIEPLYIVAICHCWYV